MFHCQIYWTHLWNHSYAAQLYLALITSELRRVLPGSSMYRRMQVKEEGSKIKGSRGNWGRYRGHFKMDSEFIFWTESIVDIWVLLRVDIYTQYGSTQVTFLGVFHGTLPSRRNAWMHFFRGPQTTLKIPTWDLIPWWVTKMKRKDESVTLKSQDLKQLRQK